MTTKKSSRGRAATLRHAYVDLENLEDRAMAWLASLGDYTRHPFEPAMLGKKPVLLVMDMQRFFLDPESRAYLPAAAAIVPGIERLIRAFRKRGQPVIFTRHEDRPSAGNGAMGRWWGRTMEPHDPLGELHPALQSMQPEFILTKNHYSAFQETRLENHLKRIQASCLVITGVMTHLCCESTAREAFMRGYPVVVGVDGTATLDETLHVAALRGLAHGFASPARLREIDIGLGL